MLDPKIKERLEEIADLKGDLFLMEHCFWSLLNKLPLKYQKEILKLAEHALENY